jgi:tetratricopeptide (TPR) repeat protein
MEAVKAVYQKALTDGVKEPLIWVGVAHIDLLEGGDINAAKQKFEQAITATTPTKGKHKGEPCVEILEAIGRANADGGSKIGDPQYGIEKLKQAAALDPKNSMVYVYMGICYLKFGGEYGGEAVKAFEQATNIDPKNVLAYYRIGMVYLSQNNEDAFMPAFGKAIDVDPTFPDTYLALFEYYKNRSVDMAKTNLDKFIKYSDKDPQNDFYLADYLYQAGKYQESLAKEKEIQQSIGGSTDQLPGLNLLYAYNYYKLGDSIQAKQNIEKYFKLEPTDKIKPADYELAVKIYSKFPESANDAVKYIDASIQTDTSKVNKNS